MPLAELVDKRRDHIRPAADIFRKMVFRNAAAKLDYIIDANLIFAFAHIGACYMASGHKIICQNIGIFFHSRLCPLCAFYTHFI